MFSRIRSINERYALQRVNVQQMCVQRNVDTIGKYYKIIILSISGAFQHTPHAFANQTRCLILHSPFAILVLRACALMFLFPWFHMTSYKLVRVFSFSRTSRVFYRCECAALKLHTHFSSFCPFRLLDQLNVDLLPSKSFVLTDF